MIEVTTKSVSNLQTSEGMLFDVGSLLAVLNGIKDPRANRGVRYSLVSLLVLLILAKLAGEDGMKGMSEWVKLRGQTLGKLLNLARHTMPHQTTYERVLAALDEGEVEQKLGQFFARQQAENITINIDGKVLRGTIPTGKTQGTHLLAAYVPETGVVLMQIEVECKANEIVAAPKLLEQLDLTGCVVTGDAMFTQRELCIQIIEGGGHFILPVKGNQKIVQHAIADAFMPAQVAKGHQAIGLEEAFVDSTSIGHGRIEKRYLTVTSDLNDYLDFPNVQQVFRLQRVIQHQATGKLSYQVIFGITSLSRQQCAPEKLLALVRSHWHIENRLHYVRDVTFHEDACQIRHTKRQRLLAILNNLVIGLIRRCDQFDYIPEARRYFDANYHEAFQLCIQ
ncbi:MAG: ISAs1 family transposase [Phototrophicaceae bacterium]